jgi:hypothetical protein
MRVKRYKKQKMNSTSNNHELGGEIKGDNSSWINEWKPVGITIADD